MCMSDTAEYWWGIRNKMPYCGIDFTHIPNSNCGHIKPYTGNTMTSEYINDINCFACLKLIEENKNTYKLKEGISRIQQKQIDREKHRYRFGKCECGSPLCERTNKNTNQIFLGCLNYPICVKTYTKQPNK